MYDFIIPQSYSTAIIIHESVLKVAPKLFTSSTAQRSSFTAGVKCELIEYDRIFKFLDFGGIIFRGILFFIVKPEMSHNVKYNI